jgi:hypothetical protein
MRPRLLRFDPSRENALREKLEPNEILSTADILFPKRVRERRENVEPKVLIPKSD